MVNEKCAAGERSSDGEFPTVAPRVVRFHYSTTGAVEGFELILPRDQSETHALMQVLEMMSLEYTVDERFREGSRIVRSDVRGLLGKELDDEQSAALKKVALMFAAGAGVFQIRDEVVAVNPFRPVDGLGGEASEASLGLCHASSPVGVSHASELSGKRSTSATTMT